MPAVQRSAGWLFARAKHLRRQKKFAEADKIVKKDGILASNTSTLCIAEMKKATARPERFVGLHFFNPATVMKLVEVIPTDTTRPSVTVDVVAFVEHIGKTPVLVKDRTGFIVNRLLTPYMCDAIRAFDAATVLPDYLGAEFCRVFSLGRKAERRKFNATVSPLEYEWYLRTV